MGSIKGELRGFRRFASFMYDRFPEVKHFTEISRDMIEDYLVYIKTDTGLTSVSYTTELSVLDNLLDEIGRELEIENLCNLFLSSDCRAYDLSLIHILDAHKALITNIFNNSTLVEVPFFQRSYVWKEDLWGRLLEDMEFVVKTKKPHFLGSIILKEGRKPRQGENFADCRTIVDGQQRLTTFLIFMKVLCLKLGPVSYTHLHVD